MRRGHKQRAEKIFEQEEILICLLYLKKHKYFYPGICSLSFFHLDNTGLRTGTQIFLFPVYPILNEMKYRFIIQVLTPAMKGVTAHSAGLRIFKQLCRPVKKIIINFFGGLY